MSRWKVCGLVARVKEVGCSFHVRKADLFYALSASRRCAIVNWMKKWALITGASQGIGYEFAKLFAEQGYNLVLVARDKARLDQVAEELRGKHAGKFKVLAKDLGTTTAAQEIFAELKREQIFVSVLVNNAGFGFQGSFAELDLEGHRYLMHVNMTALMELTHLFLGPMLERHEGRILNVASIAAFQPGPYMNLYYASKAFVYLLLLRVVGEN